MIRPSLILTFISLICLRANSQAKTWQEYYSFSDEILKQQKADTTGFAAYAAAQQFSYIGAYQKTLKTWDLQEDPSKKLTAQQENNFDNYHPKRARNLILEKAKNEQIVILNEAHHQPMHRVFTTSLLQGLYNQGYRYFGAETIGNYDLAKKEVQQYGFPTLGTGYYTREPMYGNLLREALEIGFEVFAYEATNFNDSIKGYREMEQAKNIKKILDNDASAKILIHCGWDHLVETPLKGWGKAMAGRLKEYTGIDPFTIDQTRLTERSAPQYQNPYWSYKTYSTDVLFVNDQAELFYGPIENKKYDARVYHPPTKYLFGRPHWVFANNRAPYFLPKKLSLNFPCLVFAFLAKEKKLSKMAIPFDIIELKDNKTSKALSLKPREKYTIVIRHSNSKEQSFDVKL